MTWKPTEQPPCEPGCTCDLNPVPEPAPAIETPEPRTCTPEDPCSFCGPVERFWASDPAPVEAPPEVERIDLRQVMKDLESPTTQVVAVDGGFRLVRRVGVIQRILDATRRNT